MAKAKLSATEARWLADLAQLQALPAFRRFLLRIFLESGMAQSAYGSDSRDLLALEGRRSLGFDIFRWCDETLSLPERATLQAVLREEINPPGDSDDEDEPDPI